MRRVQVLLLLLTLCFSASAQAEMADTMRAEGKIYTLVIIIVTIIIGLVGYMVVIDRKVSRLEKKLEKSEGGKP